MIRQFDVVENPDPDDVGARPYIVVLQSDLVRNLLSVVVAPLVPKAGLSWAHRLNPIVTVENREYWLAVHELFAVERRMLKRSVGNIHDRRDAVIAAVDFLFTGV